MPVSQDDVRHIADLARLQFDDATLDELVMQLNGILDHMAVLSSVDTSGAEADVAVAGGTPLREDAGPSLPLHRPLDAFAPATRDGFILVPRLDTHDDLGGA